jgi:hypothetical protein
MLSSSDEPEFRDGPVAVVLATRACNSTDWKNWEYVESLAAAYAEVGDFAKAIRFQKSAIDLSEQDTNRTNDDLKGLQGRMWLYEHHQPFRLGPEVEPPLGAVKIALGIFLCMLMIVGAVSTVKFFRRKLQSA